MKKIYLLFLVFIYSFPVANAWYYVVWNHTYTATSGLTACASGSASTSSTLVVTTTSAPTSGSFYCIMEDNIAPTYTITYSTPAWTWTNNDVTVDITCLDAESWCNMYSITSWTISWNTYSRTFSSNTSWSIILKDNASNQTTVNYSIANIDKTIPVISDITWNWVNLNNTYFIANNSKNFDISVGTNGWSPIESIKWQFEKSNANALENLTSSTNGNLSVTRNVSLIDHWVSPSDLNANNYRLFTFKVTEVKDAAWNIMSPLPTFTYYVYAWDIDLTKSTVAWTNNFDDETADWSEKTLTVTLNDAYNNKIIPVYLSNWTTLKRSVSLKLNYDNSLRLNQFDNTWVWVTLTKFDSNSHYNSSLNNNVTDTTTITEKTNIDWIYNLKFKVYSPTSNSNWSTETRAKWWFKINNIIWTVLDNPIDKTISWASNIDFKFKPVYYIDITWDLSPSWSWFVEWTTQSWTLIVTKNLWVAPTNSELYFVQSWTTLNYFDWAGLVNDTWTWTMSDITASSSSIWTSFLTWLWDITKKIATLFTLNNYDWNWDWVWDWFVDDITDLRLYQYIRYVIEPAWANKTVIYLAWILNELNTNSFETLKIYWITNISDDKQKDLLADQDAKDIQNLAWDITKASLKKDIRKRAINTIKFIDTTGINLAAIGDITNDSWNTTNNWWISLWNILYYQYSWSDAWKNAVIDDSSLLTGKKTLIVRWWNVRIKSNIINSASSDILWIIVLKDDDWNWGKLYIDSTVDQVNAVIYSDKSIIWYNEYYDNWYTWANEDIIKHEVDWNINTNILDNQLYIYWSVFSENTIWASRLSPPVCPFWTTVQGITCNSVEAQKYDFNYLRTWLGSNPKYTWDPVTWDNYPVVIKYNSSIQSGPPPLFSEE
jgi:hypothetical protein